MSTFPLIAIFYIFLGVMRDILIAVFRALPLALPLSMMTMFLFMYANEHGWSSWGFASQAVRTWKRAYAESSLFRREFLLVFYAMLALSRTVFLRETWPNPLSNVFGGWGFYDSNGYFTLEAIENFILFIPFTLLLSSVLHRVEQTERAHPDAWVLWRASRVSAAFSLFIECMQVVLRLGTFQIADLVYNTAGGVLGAVLFYLVVKIRGHGVVHLEVKREDDGQATAV
jgi:glycopeptide antibiotics resistance protein